MHHIRPSRQVGIGLGGGLHPHLAGAFFAVGGTHQRHGAAWRDEGVHHRHARAVSARDLGGRGMDRALKQVVRLAGDQRTRAGVEVVEQLNAADLLDPMRGEVLLEDEVVVAACLTQCRKGEHVLCRWSVT